MFDLIEVGDESITQIGLGFGVLYHLTTDRSRPQLFLEGRGSLTIIDVDESASQFGIGVGVGVGVGVKAPLASQFAFRADGGYIRLFENSDDGVPGADVIALSIGLSFLLEP